MQRTPESHMVLVHDDDLARIAGSGGRNVSGHPYIGSFPF